MKLNSETGESRHICSPRQLTFLEKTQTGIFFSSFINHLLPNTRLILAERL